ncbi:MAG: hypothetical protein IH919_09360 [Deltaproteobacteria bacterium]|nr:hypothetical protein [Deltaproteobacteria bacterium]
MQKKSSLMSFLLGAVLVLSVFLLIGASKAKNEGRYQMTVMQDGMYVIDSTTGRIKIIRTLRKKWESGTTVLDWNTNYIKLKAYKTE